MRILAVDDDTLSLDLLEALVSQVGTHDFVRAESAAVALDVIAKETVGHFDCLLLDIQMPHIDGIELCKIIRSNPEYKRTPILMVTRMSDKPNIDSAFVAGATDYLTKPFELSELRGRLQIIENLLEENRANTSKLFAAQSALAANLKTPECKTKTHILAPVEIIDVHGVVEYHALENYVAQLSRKSLFGSTVTALKITNFDDLYEKASDADLGFMITDVAEAISDAFMGISFLMAYSGNGTYVCVLEGGWQPDTKVLADSCMKIIKPMGLCLTGGEPLRIDLFGGPAVRLISRIGARAVDALNEAQENVEKAYAASFESKNGSSLWSASTEIGFWGAS